MHDKKFDIKKLEKLNNPSRLNDIPPDHLLDLLDSKPAGVWVDIGAGTGFFSVALLKAARPSRIYACDLSEIMVDWMTAHVVPDYPQIIPVKSEEVRIPIDDHLADLVLMMNLHHELEHPVQTIQESYRLLKPGGTLMIVDWKKQETDGGPPVAIRCEPTDVQAQLRDNGFDGVMIAETLPKHFVVVGRKVS
jgi:ubiquinone/menaquinone biosynthesis C-methylase UbiE